MGAAETVTVRTLPTENMGNDEVGGHGRAKAASSMVIKREGRWAVKHIHGLHCVRANMEGCLGGGRTAASRRGRFRARVSTAVGRSAAGCGWRDPGDHHMVGREGTGTDDKQLSVFS